MLIDFIDKYFSPWIYQQTKKAKKCENIQQSLFMVQTIYHPTDFHCIKINDDKYF